MNFCRRFVCTVFFSGIFLSVICAQGIDFAVMKVSKKKASVKEYSFANACDGALINESSMLVDEKGKPIVYFVKNMFPKDFIEKWIVSFEKIVRDKNVGNVSLGNDKIAYDEKKVKWTGFKTKLGAQATTFHAWDVLKKDEYDSIMSPFFNAMSEVFSLIAPAWYQDHIKILNMNNNLFRIGQSAFSTVSLNLSTPGKSADAQTFFHRDTGHAAGGYEFLAVLGDSIEGGDLILPEYGVTLKMGAGDLIIMKGYDLLHGNSPLKCGKKLSVLLHIFNGHDQKLG